MGLFKCHSGQHHYRKGRCPTLEENRFALAHALYDGKTAFRASEAARSAHLPFIVSFHGGFDVHAKIFDSRYTEWTREVLEQADAVTVVCAADIRRLEAIGVKRAVNVLPVPVDCENLPTRGQSDPHALLVVARLIPKKGVDIALQALSKLPRHYRLTIIGDGECRIALESLAASLNVAMRVRWLGFQTLTQTLMEMSRSAVLLHPARVAADGNAEGNPQTILWAQAIDLPVVTTSTDSLAEIVHHNITGLLVPSESPSLLAQSARSIVENPLLSQRLTVTAKERVHRKHDLRVVCESYYSLYLKVLNGSPS